MRRVSRLCQRISLAAIAWALAAMAPAALAQSRPDKSTALGEVWVYTTAPGDTLIGLAERFLKPPADWRALQRVNRVASPRSMPIGSELRIPLDWLRSDATVAEILSTAGQVQMGDGSAAATGRSLRSQDTLVTGAQSSVVIGFADGSRVRLAERSRLTLERMLQLRGSGLHLSTVQLREGEAETRAPPGRRLRFEIRTPVLDLGVRGTDFRARFEGPAQTARLEVLSGQVAAAAQPVAAGFGVVGTPAGVSAPAPLAPAPALAGLPTLIERLPLGFDWPGQAPAWRAQVFESDGAERLVLDGRFERPAARWPDLPDGSYRLRVRAQNRQGLEGQDAEHRFRVKARPEPPLLRQPDLGQRVVGPEARFLWAPSQAAARYRLQVAPSADFNSPLHDRKGLDEARLTLPMPPGRWVWRMASITADGDQGPWSDPYEFEQLEIPPAPSAEPPQTETGGVVLRWKAPREGSRTQFQLARDREFTQLVEDQTLDASHIRFANPPPGRYAIRLRTIDAVGTIGPWAATSELNIEAPPPPPPPWWWWLAPVLLWLWVI